ncbi:hypothetical protein HY478_02080 [Candidatus Uhrbacteria bacterium]|nr:hypothetical protein [Candidatus Uhrbacteria bacterium]
MPTPKGFTLLEILIVLVLVIMIVVMSAVLGRQTILNQELERVRETIRSELVRAQGDTIAGTRDASWGVAFSTNTVTRFQGTSYATRNQAFDAVTTFQNVTITGPTEIVFSRPEGVPTGTGTITVTLGTRTTTVTVNAAGAITVQ